MSLEISKNKKKPSSQHINDPGAIKSITIIYFPFTNSLILKV